MVRPARLFSTSLLSESAALRVLLLSALALLQLLLWIGLVHLWAVSVTPRSRRQRLGHSGAQATPSIIARKRGGQPPFCLNGA
jgi:hypothetical protein